MMGSKAFLISSCMFPTTAWERIKLFRWKSWGLVVDGARDTKDACICKNNYDKQPRMQELILMLITWRKQHSCRKQQQKVKVSWGGRKHTFLKPSARLHIRTQVWWYSHTPVRQETTLVFWPWDKSRRKSKLNIWGKHAKRAPLS